MRRYSCTDNITRDPLRPFLLDEGRLVKASQSNSLHVRPLNVENMTSTFLKCIYTSFVDHKGSFTQDTGEGHHASLTNQIQQFHTAHVRLAHYRHAAVHEKLSERFFHIPPTLFKDASSTLKQGHHH